MCQQVRIGDESYGNLRGLLDAGVIFPQHLPSDPELGQAGVSALEVCFCSVDVEEILVDAGVRFEVLFDGDVRVLR